MKVAFTYNLNTSKSEEQAEFDSEETVELISTALTEAEHEVECIEVSGATSALIENLESFDPDIIFNTAEGIRGPMREAFYPSLFEELDIPYTGSSPRTLTLTLDKWLTKTMLHAYGIDTPRSIVLRSDNMHVALESNLLISYPLFIKPNYEGSSKGIARESVIEKPKELIPLLQAGLRKYTDGILLEEFISGINVSVGYVNGLGHDDGLLSPIEYFVQPTHENPYNVYDYPSKSLGKDNLEIRCPAEIPRDLAARIRLISHNIIKILDIRDTASIDYRITDDGRIYFLEINALPALTPNAPIQVAMTREGAPISKTITAILNAAALRAGVATKGELGIGRKRKRSRPVRIGFTYNMRRENSGDYEAEWDLPETITAISSALTKQGHIVIPLEATPDLPRVLSESNVDFVFNIAEGVEGRNREAQVPALCELLNIPYAGSDAATLAIALDKALSKKVLTQHNILTPAFQVMESGREKLSPDLQFPLIVKPNTEGSSKGIDSANVVDNEEELRTTVRIIIEQYRQPVLVEEYISGREFTVALLGYKRPRVLPPMEIKFIDESNKRPVYDYAIKQDWKRHIYYQCPAILSPAELKAVEKIARATFMALDCRDVARVDLRITEDGSIHVLEINPLPGLTPNYSDLVLIAQSTGMDYNSLIAEIIDIGLRRLRREKRHRNGVERIFSANGTNSNYSQTNAKSQKNCGPSPTR